MGNELFSVLKGFWEFIFFAALGTMANLLIMHWRTTLDQLLPNREGCGAGHWRAPRQHLKEY